MTTSAAPSSDRGRTRSLGQKARPDQAQFVVTTYHCRTMSRRARRLDFVQSRYDGPITLARAIRCRRLPRALPPMATTMIEATASGCGSEPRRPHAVQVYGPSPAATHTTLARTVVDSGLSDLVARPNPRYGHCHLSLKNGSWAADQPFTMCPSTRNLSLPSPRCKLTTMTPQWSSDRGRQSGSSFAP